MRRGYSATRVTVKGRDLSAASNRWAILGLNATAVGLFLEDPHCPSEPVTFQHKGLLGSRRRRCGLRGDRELNVAAKYARVACENLPLKDIVTG
jgi:hypothetical protein